MVKYKSVKSKSNIFKSLGLLALIIFTFYFIYNYLATGSFSLKPRASEIVTTDVNNNCSLIKDNSPNSGCDTYLGCKWIVGPSTTKTESVNCTKDFALRGQYGCKITYTDSQVNSTCNETRYTTQTTYTYSCSVGSASSSGDCFRAGGKWISTPHNTNTPYIVQVPCKKTVTNESYGTGTNTVTVPGVGSCTGTLKPLLPQLTPKSTPVVPGDPRVVNPAPSTPAPNTGTCSAGTRCSTTKSNTLDICIGGVVKSQFCFNGCDPIKNACRPIVNNTCTKPQIDTKTCSVRSNWRSKSVQGFKFRNCTVDGVWGKWTDCIPEIDFKNGEKTTRCEEVNCKVSEVVIGVDYTDKNKICTTYEAVYVCDKPSNVKFCSQCITPMLGKRWFGDDLENFGANRCAVRLVNDEATQDTVVVRCVDR